jgi:hypothetical protein
MNSLIVFAQANYGWKYTNFSCDNLGMFKEENLNMH